MQFISIIFCTFAAKRLRNCSRSAIDALQRHTLHLQVREASLLSLNRSFGSRNLTQKRIYHGKTYQRNPRAEGRGCLPLDLWSLARQELRDAKVRGGTHELNSSFVKT